MEDGEYTIYVVQCRRTHESAWLKPDGKLKPLKSARCKEWFFASFDRFGFAWEPDLDSDSHEETHANNHFVDRHGYTTMTFALAALKRLHQASEDGRFDDEDTYKHRTQAIRYEFRLVKMEISQKTTTVDLPEVVDAL